VEKPGIYTLIIDGVSPTGAAVQVSARDEILVPLVDDPFPPFDTPTVSNARGVNPICTRNPEPCPLHDITLSEALKIGKPILYLVGTPAYCSTGTCSPALDGVLKVRGEFGDSMTFVHAEIYTDDTLSTVAPAVTSLNMTYEPALSMPCSTKWKFASRSRRTRYSADEGQLKLLPQPQVRVAFGLLILNPASCKPSW
jgi:hypothetical protein